jgi:hypothetical protein
VLVQHALKQFKRLPIDIERRTLPCPPRLQIFCEFVWHYKGPRLDNALLIRPRSIGGLDVIDPATRTRAAWTSVLRKFSQADDQSPSCRPVWFGLLNYLLGISLRPLLPRSWLNSCAHVFMPESLYLRTPVEIYLEVTKELPSVDWTILRAKPVYNILLLGPDRPPPTLPPALHLLSLQEIRILCSEIFHTELSERSKMTCYRALVSVLPIYRYDENNRKLCPFCKSSMDIDRRLFESHIFIRCTTLHQVKLAALKLTNHISPRIEFDIDFLLTNGAFVLASHPESDRRTLRSLCVAYKVSIFNAIKGVIYQNILFKAPSTISLICERLCEMISIDIAIHGQKDRWHDSAILWSDNNPVVQL